jgi:hypothetical protein
MTTSMSMNIKINIKWLRTEHVIEHKNELVREHEHEHVHKHKHGHERVEVFLQIIKYILLQRGQMSSSPVIISVYTKAFNGSRRDLPYALNKHH